MNKLGRGVVTLVVFGCSLGIVVNGEGERRQLRSLEQLVEAAEIVGVVDVFSKDPVTFEFEGEIYSCGYVYSATVKELLKGNVSTVRFFGDIDTDLGEKLAVIFSVDALEARRALDRVGDALDEFDVARANCRLSSEGLSVYSSPKTLFMFDEYAIARLGGSWLRLERDSPLADVRFRRSEVRSEEKTYEVVSWDDVRGAIRHAVDLLRQSEEHPVRVQ